MTPNVVARIDRPESDQLNRAFDPLLTAFSSSLLENAVKPPPPPPREPR